MYYDRGLRVTDLGDCGLSVYMTTKHIIVICSSGSSFIIESINFSWHLIKRKKNLFDSTFMEFNQKNHFLFTS